MSPAQSFSACSALHFSGGCSVQQIPNNHYNDIHELWLLHCGKTGKTVYCHCAEWQSWATSVQDRSSIDELPVFRTGPVLMSYYQCSGQVQYWWATSVQDRSSIDELPVFRTGQVLMSYQCSGQVQLMSYQCSGQVQLMNYQCSGQVQYWWATSVRDRSNWWTTSVQDRSNWWATSVQDRSNIDELPVFGTGPILMSYQCSGQVQLMSYQCSGQVQYWWATSVRDRSNIDELPVFGTGPILMSYQCSGQVQQGWISSYIKYYMKHGMAYGYRT